MAATVPSSSSSAAAVVKDMTQNEYRELRRVFNFLSNFAAKQRLRRDLEPRVERRERVRAYLRSPDTMKLVDESGAEVPGDPAGLRGKPGSGFGIGAGVRVDSPVGPLRLEYATNDHGHRRFHFGIGKSF